MEYIGIFIGLFDGTTKGLTGWVTLGRLKASLECCYSRGGIRIDTSAICHLY